ncbi:MAG: aryldialkylphosphatase, partial [SAR202 cluster bacterium]|nr:aryldialkylphosphatase [SAR202 cluster bacterium]
LAEFDMLNDAQRMDFIQRLVAEGYVEKVVMAQDICTKHRLVAYGGHGYGHVLHNIVPRMRKRGFSGQDINSIIVENPARVLAFA